ncbi:54S ribosomal protein L32, mitochondrial [[Candida] jaroonii]|uniref:54S ribosomal protein L32, mitochondrial n=1 Tax=[Candida] jaroonii TaxID=467808 RepID=A0ACA9Y642_9ASCO|nr:54S ribosomal protein L32, mitochondrial [[Candida] jaroonii]
MLRSLNWSRSVFRPLNASPSIWSSWNNTVYKGSITIFLPNLREILEEMILKAAPKKKPSYRKTRQKLYAPGDKKIQPLENIVRCPACGAVKRSHFMCMNCFGEIKAFLKSLKPSSKPAEFDIDKVDKDIIYPSKRLNEHEKRLQKKDWIPIREKPLMFDHKQIKPRK